MKRRVTIIPFLLFPILFANALNIYHLRVNGICNPVGIDAIPKFSWIIESDERSIIQESYRIVIRRDDVEDVMVYDSGDVDSDNSTNVNPTGLQLLPSIRYYWEVTVKDNKGNTATSSECAQFVTGLLDAGWSGAQWIKNVEGEGVPRFRKLFPIKKKVKEAWLYSSALGLYDLKINGQRVGHIGFDGQCTYEELKPGWTDYRKTINYQTHDVTSYLHQGQNIIGAIVANGWWNGNISVGTYGRKSMAFLAKMLIVYADGTQDILVTDESWGTNTDGPLAMGDIWDGEQYDAVKEDAWTSEEGLPNQWKPCDISTDFAGSIVSLKGSEVYALPSLKQSVKSVKIYEGTINTGSDFGTINVTRQYSGHSSFLLHRGETAIIDFGQNIVGWTPFNVVGPKGTQLRIRYSEMLNDDGSADRGNDGPGGSLYLSNLRLAKATLLYTLNGDENGECYQPWSTYFGFRFCELTADNDIEIKDIFGLPISSQTEECGTIITSNSSVNQLISNIQWGQRGNYVSIPTDCPQRNERYGWTGDSQAFCRTGMYNGTTEAFYRKYLSDLRDSQKEDGSYPDMCPAVYDWYGNAGWADAGVIIPYNLYLMYGNVDILREQYDSMEKYMTYVASKSDGEYKFQGAGVNYGDWLAFDKCDNRYVSVAYYAYDALLMSRMSAVLSLTQDDKYSRKSQEYATLYEEIKEEFNKRYWNPLPAEHTQTTYILPLAFDLLGKENIEMAESLLCKAINENGGLLSTGFLGTSLFLPALSKHALNNEAYNLLLQRGNPSWMYSIDQGATTIWERWDSYTIEKGFGPATMNSFNHYAYGAVGEWMYRYMNGIDCNMNGAGFKHIILKPTPDMRKEIPNKQDLITESYASYLSIYGKICSAWKIENDGSMNYTCTIPANTTATLYLPINDDGKVVMEGNVKAEESEGVSYIGNISDCKVYNLDSGEYHFYFASSTMGINDDLRDDTDIHIGQDIIYMDRHGIVSLALFSLNGMKLRESKGGKALNIADLNYGAYIVMVRSSEGSKYYKVIKN